MSFHLAIDLDNATLADLEALVAAAKTAGVDKRATILIEDDQLKLQSTQPHAPRGGEEFTLGDSAVKSVIDILTGRQEPPRR